MRLVSFSVTNFRSITAAHKIPISQSTVLIGKNNEGKSNLLRALNIAMTTLSSHAQDDVDRYTRISEGPKYSWSRDFPISLQGRKNGTESIFRLEFELAEEEIADFRDQIKSNLNGTLPIEITFNKANSQKIHVPKRGPGGTALSMKSSRIAKYIAERIQFNYIPAVRTEEEAQSVVQDMLSVELSQLESDPEYLAAIQKISDLQQPILRRVSKTIQDSLKQFLPNIKGVTVRVPNSARRSALRSQCKVEVDDGSNTLLEYKGDGVKSLAALGLLKDRNNFPGVSIVAIEEPESHLHPGAMHSLRGVIEKLSAKNQVVITTHCPLFVERASINRNILIDGNNAKTAKDIGSIRTLLGIRASDNLVNASHVVVVEGAEDVIALSALLPTLSAKIGKALKQHQIVLEQIGGAGNLSYKLTQLANALCVAHVLLDNDEAGKKAYDKAEADGAIKVSDVTFVNCRGMPSSELEDCFEPSVYIQVVSKEFGVDLTEPAFRGRGKWSDRARSCFEQQGKPWNNRIETQLKAVVAEAVSKNPENALHAHKRASIDALVKSLEQKLGE